MLSRMCLNFAPTLPIRQGDCNLLLERELRIALASRTIGLGFFFRIYRFFAFGSVPNPRPSDGRNALARWELPHRPGRAIHERLRE